MLLDLVFIRHGMTAGNQERRYIGQNDDQPLSEHGRRMLIARQADGLYPRVQAVYTSPLCRCRETARLLFPALVPVILQALIELDFGSFEGKTYDQLKDNPAYRCWIDTAGMTPPPGGEGGQEFAERLKGAMRQIAQDAVCSGVRQAAVVTHGGRLMSLLSSLGQGLDEQDFYRFQSANGGGFTARMDTDTLVLTDIRAL